MHKTHDCNQNMHKINHTIFDSLLMLSYFVSQRIRRVATDNRVFLSLDLTTRDGLQCLKDTSSDVALDTPEQQFRALELQGSPLQHPYEQSMCSNYQLTHVVVYETIA